MDRFEFSGAFGDLPLLFPLLTGMVIICGINPVPVFVIMGISYLVCSFYYKLPMPIQPLKAFATIAIIQKLSPSIIHAGGLLIGIIFLVLSFIPAIKYLDKVCPKPVRTGIQLSLGILLLKSGSALIFTKNFPDFNQLFIKPDIVLVIICSFILLLFSNSKKVPALLPIIFLGFFSSMVFGLPDINFVTKCKDTISLLYIPTLNDIKISFFLLVIPQIPLTLVNSVVATNDTADFYFKERAQRVSPRSLCLSIGLINTIGSIFGGMPSCHGSTGLTAHYRFGARTENATIITGIFFYYVYHFSGKKL